MKLRRLLLGCGLALATVGVTATGEAQAAENPCGFATECYVETEDGSLAWMTTTRQIMINMDSILFSFSGIEIPGKPFPADGFNVSSYLNNKPPGGWYTFYTAKLFQDGELVATGELRQAAAGGFSWNFIGTVVGPNTTIVWDDDILEMILVPVVSHRFLDH